ncbi:hypothetical protein PR048_002006 [Dryococelus australis]|uniref:Uncharacterized protein n=1 Tax=Dryococelus australis TaxID=614101 RepID=A0ABQ9IJP1_9NEOP|nr:hypothetical protein PR048_002006 [Dryococelus australis]
MQWTSFRKKHVIQRQLKYNYLLSSDVLKSYHHHLKKRLQQALQPPHILAKLKDPKFKGQHLSEEREYSTEMWLAEHPILNSCLINDPEYYFASMMHAQDVQVFSSQQR